MRWRERGALWRALLGLVIAIAVLLVLHLSLLAAGLPPAVRSAWVVLAGFVLLLGFGVWCAVAVLPARLRSTEERFRALERRTPGQDTWILVSARRGVPPCRVVTRGRIGVVS